MELPRWAQPELFPKSDTPRTHRYRMLQSWYRDTVLRIGPGSNARQKLGSMLPPGAEHERANFLTPTIADYVDARVPVVQAHNGTLDANRLRQNMLSSMPLCFNLFGELRSHPEVAAAVLRSTLGLPIQEILEIDVEWIPDGVHPLGDRTAFDAFVRYRTTGGDQAFIGVETKYTEPFSAKEYEGRDAYKLLTSEAHGFKEAAFASLVGSATNQLWRNALLTIALKNEGSYGNGHVLVVAMSDDPHARKAVDGVCAQLHEPTGLVRELPLEKLVAACAEHEATSEWAKKFERRYLDLRPVAEVLKVGRPVRDR